MPTWNQLELKNTLEMVGFGRSQVCSSKIVISPSLILRQLVGKSKVRCPIYSQTLWETTCHTEVFHVVPQCQSLETDSLKRITRIQVHASLEPFAMIVGCDLAGHLNHDGQSATKNTMSKTCPLKLGMTVALEEA